LNGLLATFLKLDCRLHHTRVLLEFCSALAKEMLGDLFEVLYTRMLRLPDDGKIDLLDRTWWHAYHGKGPLFIEDRCCLMFDALSAVQVTGIYLKNSLSTTHY
jgi:hypothetical protein